MVNIKNKYMKDATFKNIPLKEIRIWEDANVRKTNIYTDTTELEQNIGAIGLQTPLLVAEVVNGGDIKYEIISGQRRYYALHKLKRTHVWCHILSERPPLSIALAMSFSENAYRQSMSDDDISNAIKKLKSKYDTNSAVAKILGVKSYKIRNYLGYSGLPNKIKDLVRARKMNHQAAIYINKKFSLQNAILIAQHYADMTRSKKTDFYASIREAESYDTLEEIIKRYNASKDWMKMTIRLPKSIMDKIIKISDKRNMTTSAYLSQEVTTLIQRKGFRGIR